VFFTSDDKNKNIFGFTTVMNVDDVNKNWTEFLSVTRNYPKICLTDNDEKAHTFAVILTIMKYL